MWHFTITIPEQYPTKAPRARLCTYMDHPNVYGAWICLDMLEDQWIPDSRTQSKADKYCGWTTAYTMHAVLLQLQAFLTDKAKDGRGKRRGQVDYMRSSAKKFTCKECGHRQSHPVPPLPVLLEPAVQGSPDPEATPRVRAKPRHSKAAYPRAEAAAAATGLDLGTVAALSSVALATKGEEASMASSASDRASESSGADELGEYKGDDSHSEKCVASDPARAGEAVPAASDCAEAAVGPASMRVPLHGEQVEAVVVAIVPGDGVRMELPSFPDLSARLCRTELVRREISNGQYVSNRTPQNAMPHHAYSSDCVSGCPFSRMAASPWARTSRRG